MDLQQVIGGRTVLHIILQRRTENILILSVLWIRIRNKIYKLDPEPGPHQSAEVKPTCMEYEPILALFKGLRLFLKLGSESGSGSASG